MEATTRTHTGKTPMPGIASAINPGSNAHLRPRIKNRTNAVAPSSAHWAGGRNVIQKDKRSEAAATAMAMASLAREWRLGGASGPCGVRMAGSSVCIRCSILNLDRATTAPDLQVVAFD